MTMTHAHQPTSHPDPLTFDPWTVLSKLGRRTTYLLLGFPLAVVSFVILVTGLSLGAGTLITVIGIPILVATVMAARGFATIERLRLSRLLDIAGDEPVRYRQVPPDAGWVRRLTAPLFDLQSWLDTIHGLVLLPLAIITWSFTITWWSLAVAGPTWPLWGWLIDFGDASDLPELLGLGDSYLARSVFYMAIGLAALATLPLAMAAMARIQATLGELLLILPSQRQARIDHLVAGRDAARAAEASSLQRLERDIHDGPQQRLVRLSMDLGRAQIKADDASPELRQAIDDAKRQTQETLDELRALSRGIAPPVLVDRGLANAVDQLAARSAIPVTSCEVDLQGRRLQPHVESAAYFVVAESLTNTAKHSEASFATVHLTIEADTLVVVVSDDGVGGAHVSKGHGLAGLDQRMRAVDGTLTVHSPVGGPTSITAEIPCG